MPAIAWNIAAGAADGAGIRASGTLADSAVLTAAVDVEPDATAVVTLQIDDMARVQLLVVTCSRYDGSVSLTGADPADPTLTLTGPIMAFGAVAARLAASLQTATVSAAAAPPSTARVEILIATAVV